MGGWSGGKATALGVVLLAGLAGWAFLLARSAEEAPFTPPTLSAAGILTEGGDAGYARALEPRTFRFPEDHGPHPDFRTEWWYVTGNLETEDGEPWAYHLTIFRTAVDPMEVDRASAWATNQIYMAHLAVTDGVRNRHRAVERVARGAVGLAGAELDPVRVWVEGWQMRGVEAGNPEADSTGLFPLRITARDEDLVVDLVLDEPRGPVLQGDRGLSQKGPEPGDASYYLSFPRIRTRGSIALQGVQAEVNGESWMDREWSTSALSPGQVGWDWFSLQLEGEGELMFYHIRREDGSPDPLSKGLRILPDGRTRLLGLEAVELEVLEWWNSPVDGTPYPSGWRMLIPGDNLSLRITPLVRNQEQLLSVRYWEGAVRLEGELDGRPVRGRGFAELTGYAAEGSGGSREGGRGVYLDRGAGSSGVNPREGD